MQLIEHNVRWGIAGLGQIAHRFASDLTQHVAHGVLTAVAARELSRANVFALRYGAERFYDSYEALALDPNIDAVYVATIHPCHKDVVALCLAQGKHVLVEKPAFTNVADWDEMAALAAANGVLLVEAMKSVVFPAYRSLRQFIVEHQVNIDFVEAAYGSHNDFDTQNRIFDPSCCGGATLDIGVYPLWLYADLCLLTGTDVVKPVVHYVRDNVDSKVDEYVEFCFAGKIRGRIRTSVTRDLPREAIIRGPQFEAVIHDKWWNPTFIDIVYQGMQVHIDTPAIGGGFEFEAEHVSMLILNHQRQSELIPASTTRRVIEIMENSLTENGFQYLIH